MHYNGYCTKHAFFRNYLLFIAVSTTIASIARAPTTPQPPTNTSPYFSSVCSAM